jgi:hypothetical protein
LRYVDPDGRKEKKYEEFTVDVLGKKVKVQISLKIDQDTRELIKKNLNAAFAKINAGKDSLTNQQTKQITRLNGVKVDPAVKTQMDKASGTFEITPHYVAVSSTDFLVGAILHDTGHLGQGEATSPSKKFVDNEKGASAFAADVARALALDKSVIDWLDEDARTGHLQDGSIPGTQPPKKRKP